MTGFGQFRDANDQRVLEVEARSVNHRFLKLQIRLPRDLARLEPDVEALIKKSLKRGSVSITIRNEELATEEEVFVDQELAMRLNASAVALARDLECGTSGPTIDTILALPGVVRPGDKSDAIDDDRKDAVLRGVAVALEGLVKMRQFEGKKLAGDLALIQSRIAKEVQKVQGRAPLVVEEYAGKLKKRLNHLLAQVADKVAVGDNEILKEVALFADKADISEELQRLESHLEQFTALLTGNEIGRKLDFLLQEMLREANTVASKASDSEIARSVIEIKTDLERLREQSHNIE